LDTRQLFMHTYTNHIHQLDRRWKKRRMLTELLKEARFAF